MSYKVMQFRYYGEEANDSNYPSGISAVNLKTGSIFKDYLPIIQLGIQYSSNTPIKFYINGASNPILTHPYGLYELNLENKSHITGLRFEDVSTKVSREKPLIIDIIYEG